jgi:hypothetical protein
MTETQEHPKKDTSAARQASLASFARRRHQKWIAELEAAGVNITVPDNYTGLPLGQ